MFWGCSASASTLFLELALELGFTQSLLLLVALAVFGVVLFVNGYLSLGFLCISVIGIIGSIYKQFHCYDLLLRSFRSCLISTINSMRL